MPVQVSLPFVKMLPELYSNSMYLNVIVLETKYVFVIPYYQALTGGLSGRITVATGSPHIQQPSPDYAQTTGNQTSLLHSPSQAALDSLCRQIHQSANIRWVEG